MFGGARRPPRRTGPGRTGTGPVLGSSVRKDVRLSTAAERIAPRADGKPDPKAVENTRALLGVKGIKPANIRELAGENSGKVMPKNVKAEAAAAAKAAALKLKYAEVEAFLEDKSQRREVKIEKVIELIPLLKNINIPPSDLSKFYRPAAEYFLKHREIAKALGLEYRPVSIGLTFEPKVTDRRVVLGLPAPLPGDITPFWMKQKTILEAVEPGLEMPYILQNLLIYKEMTPLLQYTIPTDKLSVNGEPFSPQLEAYGDIFPSEVKICGTPIPAGGYLPQPTAASPADYCKLPNYDSVDDDGKSFKVVDEYVFPLETLSVNSNLYANTQAKEDAVKTVDEASKYSSNLYPLYFIIWTKRGGSHGHISLLILDGGKLYSIGFGYMGNKLGLPSSFLGKAAFYSPDNVVNLEGKTKSGKPHTFRLISMGFLKPKHLDRIQYIVSANIGKVYMNITFNGKRYNLDFSGFTFPLSASYRYMAITSGSGFFTGGLNCTSFMTNVFREKITCSKVITGGVDVPGLCRGKFDLATLGIPTGPGTPGEKVAKTMNTLFKQVIAEYLGGTYSPNVYNYLNYESGSIADIPRRIIDSFMIKPAETGETVVIDETSIYPPGPTGYEEITKTLILNQALKMGHAKSSVGNKGKAIITMNPEKQPIFDEAFKIADHIIKVLYNKYKDNPGIGPVGLRDLVFGGSAASGEVLANYAYRKAMEFYEKDGEDPSDDVDEEDPTEGGARSRTRRFKHRKNARRSTRHRNRKH